MRLCDEGRLQDAYDLVTEKGEEVGGNPSQIYNFRYCISSKMGEVDRALGIMREAIDEKGYWYGFEYLLQDEDLAPLRGLPEFVRMSQVCHMREQEAKSSARPEMKVIGAHTRGRGALIVALHGNGDYAELMEDHWQSCIKRGCVLALPQSSQVRFWHGYTWADLARGRNELMDHMERIESDRMYGAESWVLAGFSGGARLALHCTLEGDVAPRGLILVAPWLPELKEWEGKVRALESKDIRVSVLCGDHDPDSYAGSKELARILTEAGVPVRLDIVKDLDHDFPEDFGERLTDILEFIKAV